VFDIHGGGIDLLFPHHENEMAQSCSAFGHDLMANVWMHNGHLQVEGEKMAKSLGNFVTIRELLDTDAFGGRSWPGEVLRLAILKTHYRQPVDFTVRALEEAESRIDRWKGVVRTKGYENVEVPAAFIVALEDDLNIHKATELMSDLGRTANLATPVSGGSVEEIEWVTAKQATEAASHLVACADVIGIELRPMVLQLSPLQKKRIADREKARKNKDWAEADRIRRELAEDGIPLRDNEDGSTTALLSATGHALGKSTARAESNANLERKR
jgi:cysteinyl-tRNA synthetase